MKISVIGMYPVEEATEPCHLVEILIEDFQGNLSFDDFTQEVDGQPRDNWQVPWLEYLLSDDGETGEMTTSLGPLEINNMQRLAFFFHYLDLSRPMLSPAGEISLLEPMSRPNRLSFIKYEPPD